MSILAIGLLSSPLYAHKPSVVISDTEKKIYQIIQSSLIPFFAVKVGDREELERDDGIALDEHHVVADCGVATLGDFAIAGVHLKPHQAIMSYKDPNKEFCILTVNDEKLTPIKMRPSSSIKADEKIYVIILKDARIKTSFQGKFLQNTNLNGSSYIETDMIFKPATTDGLYDSDGNLIGITTDNTSNNHGLAIPTEKLLTAIKAKP
jgi:S1-C subfamily serine protease